MSTQLLLLKNGVICFPRSSTDISQVVTSLNLTKTSVGLSNVDNTSDLNKPVSTAIQAALDLKANISSIVDLTNNQSIGGIKTFTGGLLLPSTTGTSVGTIWRNVDNLEYKDSTNTPKIILNSAGNLSNVSNKQTSLNNLVGVQTANRVLRSDGTNVTLSQVALNTDVTNVLPISNGGTGSNTLNFVDLTTNQTIGGNKSFSSLIRVTNTTQSTSTSTGALIVSGGQAVVGNFYVGGFTLLGDNIAVKQKQITGTTGTAGTDVSIAHGLTGSAIRSVTCIVTDTTSRLMAPGMTLSGANNEYYVYTTGTSFFLYVPPTNSNNVANRPFTALITYTS